MRSPRCGSHLGYAKLENVQAVRFQVCYAQKRCADGDTAPLNWPLDDKYLDKIQKMYRLVAYQRCSRWVFQILGNIKNRRDFGEY